MIQAIESIRRSVVVPVPRERAFEVFTSGMTGWWPSDHHIGSAPIEQIVIEPREGGRWYTRHTDGSETSTGYVAAWEPPERVVVTWQISAEWKYDPSLVTTVEVRFVAEAPRSHARRARAPRSRPLRPRRRAHARDLQRARRLGLHPGRLRRRRRRPAS